MNMSNITFEVPILSTLFFQKCLEKIHSRLNIVTRVQRVMVGIMLVQRHKQVPSITSALGQCIVLSSVSGAGMESVTCITMQQSENTVQSPNAVSMPGQRRRLWVSIETTLGECHVFADVRRVYSRPSDGLVLGQRRRRLTGIEPDLMGCDAGPTLSWSLVGRPTSSVGGT